jgi:hypothetical protein
MTITGSVVRLLTCALLVGCIEPLAPAELGLGRRIGSFPGEVAAVLPPMTDRDGNLYVATGVPDGRGIPQPGIAHVGGSRGGWSDGCPTGEGTRGGAVGWVGATSGRGWLWTGTAILELDATSGACKTLLDIDPVSASDVVMLAVAPWLSETVSGTFAVAMIATGSDPTPRIVTIDLDLGVLRPHQAFPGATVLATGDGGNQAAFLVADGLGTRIVLALPHLGQVGSIPVAGSLASSPVVGQIAFGEDGDVAAIVGSQLAVGTVTGITATAPVEGLQPWSIERDDEARLWVVGERDGAPWVSGVTGGQLATVTPWTCASDVDAVLSAGVVVIDERTGGRVATRWQAHGAHGGSALLAMRGASPYAVGVRAVLIADPPVDRGGIPYSQIASVPVGVVFR